MGTLEEACCAWCWDSDCQDMGPPVLPNHKNPPLLSGRSGRPTFFTAVFNTFTPAIKEAWIHSLQMAKLGLGILGLWDVEAGLPARNCGPFFLVFFVLW